MVPSSYCRSKLNLVLMERCQETQSITVCCVFCSIRDQHSIRHVLIMLCLISVYITWVLTDMNKLPPHWFVDVYNHNNQGAYYDLLLLFSVLVFWKFSLQSVFKLLFFIHNIRCSLNVKISCNFMTLLVYLFLTSIWLKQTINFIITLSILSSQFTDWLLSLWNDR